MAAAPLVASATEKRDKYPDNHDCAAARAVRLADGTPAWLAAVADGCGGDDRGTRVARLAVARFSEAVAAATQADFSSPEALRAWSARWGTALQNEVTASALKGGNSTLVASVLLDDRRTAGSWRLATVNVGDSFAHLYRGPALQRESAVPAAPADNPNTAESGGGLRRAVGLPLRAAHSVLDSDLVRLPAAGGPYLLVLASDGLESYVRTIGAGPKKRLVPCRLMGIVDYLETLGAGLPFDRLPQALLDRSLANARRCGFSGLDNSTVAMIAAGWEPGPLASALARARAIRARVPGSGVRPVRSVPKSATVRKRRTLRWIAAAAVFAALAGGAVWFFASSGSDETDRIVVRGGGGSRPPKPKPVVGRPVPRPAGNAAANAPASVPVTNESAASPTNALSAVGSSANAPAAAPVANEIPVSDSSTNAPAAAVEPSAGTSDISPVPQTESTPPGETQPASVKHGKKGPDAKKAVRPDSATKPTKPEQQVELSSKQVEPESESVKSEPEPKPSSDPELVESTSEFVAPESKTIEPESVEPESVEPAMDQSGSAPLPEAEPGELRSSGSAENPSYPAAEMADLAETVEYWLEKQSDKRNMEHFHALVRGEDAERCAVLARAAAYFDSVEEMDGTFLKVAEYFDEVKHEKLDFSALKKKFGDTKKKLRDKWHQEPGNYHEKGLVILWTLYDLPQKPQQIAD